MDAGAPIDRSETTSMNGAASPVPTASDRPNPTAGLGREDRVLLLHADAIIEGVIRAKAIGSGRTWPWPAAILAVGIAVTLLQPDTPAAAGIALLAAAMAAAVWIVSENSARHVDRMTEIYRASGAELLRTLTSWHHHSIFDPPMEAEIALRIGRLQAAL